MANDSSLSVLDLDDDGIRNSSSTNEEFMNAIVQVNTVAYFYVMPCFLTTGILTNVLNIYVLRGLGKTQDKKHKGSVTTYMYLNWLAFAQLLSCLSVIPSLLNLYRESLSYSWAYYYAHFEILFMNSLTSTSIYIVVGLSLDRYVAVCRPYSYQVLKGVRLASLRIVTSFAAPPVFYTPLCFFQLVQKNSNGTGFTTVDNINVTEKSFWQFWNVAVELFHRLLPAMVVVTLNMCIIIKFHSIKKSLKRPKVVENKPTGSAIPADKLIKIPVTPQASSASRGRSEQESKMFILLMSVIVVFLGTTLPAAFLGLTDTFGHHYSSVNYEIFRAIANLLEVLGFSLNFFLYFFLVHEVREKLMNCICQRKEIEKSEGEGFSKDT